MSTIKLAAGAQSAYASCLTTELNSLASGSAIAASAAIDNTTNLDMEIEFSFTTGGSITPTGTPYVAIYIYPLNGDGTTYGDSRFGSATAAIPGTTYWAGSCNLVASAGTQVGTFGIPGIGTKLLLGRGSFKPVLYNFSGVTLSSSGNIVYYRTIDRSVA